jgi:SOS-response transcriptional repressor LexA
MRTRHLGYRMQQVLHCVERTIASDGLAPSYEMIRKELGMRDRVLVHRVVKRLERGGYLHRAGSGRVRRIRLEQGQLSEPVK